MPTYNIYDTGANVGTDSPAIVIELNDDETEIVSVVNSNSENDAETASVIEGYQNAGFSATDIVARLAGSYGYVERARTDGGVVSAAVDAEDEVPVEGESTAPPLEIDGTMAMTSDAGLVVTLLQKNESGPMYRHGKEWVSVVDPSVFDGLTYVGVDENSIETYDSYENDGMLAPISEYIPSPGGPFWPDLIVNDDDLVLDEETGVYEPESGITEANEVPEDEESVTASVTLNSEEDLTAAIAAAVEDPDLRWYVQRRVEALGLKAALPWLRNN